MASNIRVGDGAKRPRYFDRQQLRADDLGLEQTYVSQRMRRMSRYLHGWGVVCGAIVEPEAGAPGTALRISEGYAVTPLGDEVYIPAGLAPIDFVQQIRTACGGDTEDCESLESVLEEEQPGAEEVYLVARPVTIDTEVRPGFPEECDHPGNRLKVSRVCETAELDVICELPILHRPARPDCDLMRALICDGRQMDVVVPDDGGDAVREIGDYAAPLPPPEVSGAENFVVLARLHMGAAGVESIDYRVRRRLLPVEILQLALECACDQAPPGPTLAPDPPAGTRTPFPDPRTGTPFPDPRTRTPFPDPRTGTPFPDPRTRIPFPDPGTRAPDPRTLVPDPPDPRGPSPDPRGPRSGPGGGGPGFGGPGSFPIGGGPPFVTRLPIGGPRGPRPSIRRDPFDERVIDEIDVRLFDTELGRDSAVDVLDRLGSVEREALSRVGIDNLLRLHSADVELLKQTLGVSDVRAAELKAGALESIRRARPIGLDGVAFDVSRGVALPVEDVPNIGAVRGASARASRLSTVADIANATAAELARVLDVTDETAEEMIRDAKELIRR